MFDATSRSDRSPRQCHFRRNCFSARAAHTPQTRVISLAPSRGVRFPAKGPPETRDERCRGSSGSRGGVGQGGAGWGGAGQGGAGRGGAGRGGAGQGGAGRGGAGRDFGPLRASQPGSSYCRMREIAHCALFDAVFGNTPRYTPRWTVHGTMHLHWLPYKTVSDEAITRQWLLDPFSVYPVRDQPEGDATSVSVRV